MKILATCIVFAAAGALAGDLSVNHVVDKATGLDAKIITIGPKDNRGFIIVDVPVKTEGDNIRQHWRTNYSIMINGGYFDADFTPTGLCRIGGRSVRQDKTDKLSGFVVIDKTGCLILLSRDDDVSKYPDVIQTGPFVIDPGGKIGIRSNDQIQAERTLIGKTKDDQILIVVTRPITLFALAGAIKAKIPEIDRLLNLDGGPSTAMKTEKDEVLNRWAVRNYIAKRTDTNQTSEPSVTPTPQAQH